MTDEERNVQAGSRRPLYGQAVKQSALIKVTETTPLLTTVTNSAQNDNGDIANRENISNKKTTSGSQPIWGILGILLIGVFVSQADTMLVMASYGPIASEFDDLQNASWLLSSYMLAMCVAQPLYGKLSDIFGRKTMLQVSYALFAGGSALCGFCQSMAHLIVARAIQGVGGAGMVSLVSIMITDLVPLEDVASYRSYINIVQTVGRSSGGAIGGQLVQSFGWRGTLAGQAPLTLLGMVLVAWRLRLPRSADENTRGNLNSTSLSSKLERVDFVGAASMSLAILSLLLALDMGGDQVSWTSTSVLLLAGTSAVSSLVFILVERCWAKEPIFPVHLLSHYDVVTSYMTLAVQNASQTAIMFFIPLYFQITRNASPSQAGGFMVPSIVGNAIGGLVAGFLIKRYRRTKWILISSAMSAAFGYTLLLLFWRGKTAAWQSIFVFPAGFATALAHSVVFVVVAVSVADADLAVAASGLYLSGSIGAVAGLSAASAFFQSCLRSALRAALLDYPHGGEVARRALEDIDYVQGLEGKIRNLVVGAYVSSLTRSFVACLCLSGMCLTIAVFSRERRLAKDSE